MSEGLKYQEYKNGEPCKHPGCLNHVSHPCEGCGRIAGRPTPTPEVGEWDEKFDRVLHDEEVHLDYTDKETIKSFIRSLLAAKTECKKCKEYECQLEAWFKVFGTTQLSHAQARLEQAEKDAPKTGEQPIQWPEIDGVHSPSYYIDIKQHEAWVKGQESMLHRCQKLNFARPVVSEDEIGFIIYKELTGYEDELARESWTAKHNNKDHYKNTASKSAEFIHHLLEGRKG